MLCTQGIQTKEGIFSGACGGDSGGPLKIRDNEDRETLIGILCDGSGCGKGIPDMFTKVSFYGNWIRCIMEQSLRWNDQRRVEEACLSEGKKSFYEKIIWD